MELTFANHNMYDCVLYRFIKFYLAGGVCVKTAWTRIENPCTRRIGETSIRVKVPYSFYFGNFFLFFLDIFFYFCGAYAVWRTQRRVIRKKTRKFRSLKQNRCETTAVTMHTLLAGAQSRLKSLWFFQSRPL